MDDFDRKMSSMDTPPTTLEEVVEQTRWTMGLFAGCGLLTGRVIVRLVRWVATEAYRIGRDELLVTSPASKARVESVKAELHRTWELESARYSLVDALKRTIAKQHCLITEQPVERLDGTTYWRLTMCCRLCNGIHHSWPEHAQLKQARQYNWMAFLVEHAHYA